MIRSAPCTDPDSVDPAGIAAGLAALLRGRRAGVLTGAGFSTESGIPDDRGPNEAHRALAHRPGAAPHGPGSGARVSG